MHGRAAVATQLLFLFWLGSGTASHATAIDWPNWRGPGMNLAVDATGTFAPGGAYRLEVAWKKPLGSGYSAVSIVDGVAVTAFAAGDHDYVGAFDTATGQERWRTALGPRYPGHWGSQDGPIATPLIAYGRVFMLDPAGRLAALSLSDGQTLWTSSLPEDHQSQVPFYGYATSPIAFEDTIIVQTGGATGALTAFEAATGAVRWSVGEGAISYQSPYLTAFNGRPLLLGLGDKQLFGIDPRSGELLWEMDHGGDGRDIGSLSTNIVPASGNRFFLKNQASGSKLFELVGIEEGGARELWNSGAIQATYVVPVYHEGHIYGATGRIFTSLSEETGEADWKSRTPGDGFPILVDDHLVVATKDGDLSVGPASPEGYSEIAAIHLFDDLVWTHATFYDGSFYVRSMAEWARVDVVSTDQLATRDSTGEGTLADSDFGRWIAQVENSAEPAAEIDRFLQAQPRLPVIEDRSKVHFIYRGAGDDLALTSDLFGGRTDRPMHRVPGSDFHFYSTELEPDARVTYDFFVDFENHVPDARNPQRAETWYGAQSSVLTMPDWRAPEFLGEASPSRRGRLETVPFSSRLCDINLPLQVYLPAGYDPRQQYPTLYINAGMQELRLGRMVQTLDNLIGVSVEPLIAVFLPIPTESADGALSWRTLYKSFAGEEKEQYRRMIVEEVLPLVESRYPVAQDPARRGLTGSGEEAAFSSFYIAAKHPELFTRIGVRSILYEAGFRHDYEKLLAGPQAQPLTIYLEWTKYDSKSEKEGWDARADSMAFAEMLTSKGYTFTGGEFHDGSSYSSWRNRTDGLLQALFPLPSSE